MNRITVVVINDAKKNMFQPDIRIPHFHSFLMAMKQNLPHSW